MITPLAFVDTETTGLHQHLGAQVWEVGLIIEGSDSYDGEWSWFLPVDLGSADSYALKIGQFYERYPREKGAVTEVREFASRFARLTSGAHLVGMVPSFDEAFLAPLLRANQACPGWHYHLIDVEAMTIGYLQGRAHSLGTIGWTDHPDDQLWIDRASQFASPPWKSDDLSRAVGVDPDAFQRHTALGDAKWTKSIYDAIIAR